MVAGSVARSILLLGELFFLRLLRLRRLNHAIGPLPLRLDIHRVRRRRARLTRCFLEGIIHYGNNVLRQVGSYLKIMLKTRSSHSCLRLGGSASKGTYISGLELTSIIAESVAMVYGIDNGEDTM